MTTNNHLAVRLQLTPLDKRNTDSISQQILISTPRGLEKLGESGNCEWVARGHADNTARIYSSWGRRVRDAVVSADRRFPIAALGIPAATGRLDFAFLPLDSHRPEDRQIGALGVKHDWALAVASSSRCTCRVSSAGGLGVSAPTTSPKRSAQSDPPE